MNNNNNQFSDFTFQQLDITITDTLVEVSYFCIINVWYNFLSDVKLNFFCL